MKYNLLDLIHLELKRIFNEKILKTITILGVMIYGCLYPQPYLGELLKQIPIAVIDNDNSSLSVSYTNYLSGVDSVLVSKRDNLQQAKEQLEAREIFAIVDIPINFEKNILNNNTSTITYYGDASYILNYSEITTAVYNVALDMSNKINEQKQIKMRQDPVIAKKSLFNIESIPLYNPQAGYASFILPPVFVLIIHQILVICLFIRNHLALRSKFIIKLIQQEDRFAVNMKNLLLPQIITFFLIFACHLVFYLLLLKFVYSIESHTYFYNICLLMIPFLLATILFAMALSFITRQSDDAFIYIAPVAMIIFFISGLSWPSESVPKILHIFNYTIPGIPAMFGFVKLLQKGASINDLYHEMIILWSMVFVYGSICYFLYKRYIYSIKYRIYHKT